MRVYQRALRTLVGWAVDEDVDGMVIVDCDGKFLCLKASVQLVLHGKIMEALLRR